MLWQRVGRNTSIDLSSDTARLVGTGVIRTHSLAHNTLSVSPARVRLRSVWRSIAGSSSDGARAGIGLLMICSLPPGIAAVAGAPSGQILTGVSTNERDCLHGLSSALHAFATSPTGLMACDTRKEFYTRKQSQNEKEH